MTQPLASFIVLSYEYETYVGRTIRSILDQTFQDFEIVVVDDASRDRSCEVVQSFGDPRIRLVRNERNMGGAWSYNRAVSLARGEYLVNLDADDWIEPQKTELQLEVFERDPELDVLGTWVDYVDAEGAPHPRAQALEEGTNREQDFNQVDAWIVRNALCRSSTMMRRSVHERIGPDDVSMVRAPDFELWTRAMRERCRFGLLPEKLTHLRVHARGVTYGDPRGSFRETCHLLAKNVVTTIEERATWASLGRIVSWIVSQEQFASMTPAERYRLLGLVLCTPGAESFIEFERKLATADPTLETAGRRALALATAGDRERYARKLERDIDVYLDARDWHRRQSEAWQRSAEELRAELEKWRRRADRIPFVGVLRRVKRLVSDHRQ